MTNVLNALPWWFWLGLVLWCCALLSLAVLVVWYPRSAERRPRVVFGVPIAMALLGILLVGLVAVEPEPMSPQPTTSASVLTMQQQHQFRQAVHPLIVWGCRLVCLVITLDIGAACWRRCPPVAPTGLLRWLLRQYRRKE